MISKQTIYEFSDFQVDAVNKTLSKNGEIAAVTPKVFDTLLVLIENAPNLVEKDELMHQIWQDRFVEESNLTFNIKMLRKVLGDDASKPKFIENVPRRGYRFIVQVNKIEGEKNGPSEPSKASKINNLRLYLPALAIIFLLAIFALAIYKANSSFNPAATFQKIKMNRITSAGKTFYAVISPDGKYIVHAKNEGEKQSLWIRQADESRDVEVLPPVEGEFLGFAVSPDSKSIFYTLLESNNSDAVLYQVPILGGASNPIFKDISSGISFSPDGNKIAFYRTSPSRGISQLFIANIDDSNEKLIAERKSPDTFETNFGVPVWHPDGKRLIAIGASNTTGVKNTLLEIGIESGNIKTFAEVPWKEIYQIAWLKSTNGLLMAVFEEETNSIQIRHVEHSSGKTRKISDDLNNYQGISLSNDEQTLVTTQTEQITRLWVNENNKTKEILSETGISSGKEGFAWTPDNRLVVRTENLGGNDIWIYDQNGKQQLTFDAKSNRHPIVCGEGKYIVYASNQTETLQLWKMNSDGKDQQFLTNGDNETEIFPHCASKSDWVVYQRGWRRPTVWKVPLAGGEPVQLVKTMSLRPTVSPDGKMVAFYSLDKGGWGLSVVSAEDGTLLKTFPIANSVTSRNLRWTPDGNNLAYTDTRNGVSNIWLQPFAGGEPKQLTNFDSELIFYFDWSPDGKNLAYTRGVITSDVFSILDVK